MVNQSPNDTNEKLGYPLRIRKAIGRENLRQSIVKITGYRLFSMTSPIETRKDRNSLQLSDVPLTNSIFNEWKDLRLSHNDSDFYHYYSPGR